MSNMMGLQEWFWFQGDENDRIPSGIILQLLVALGPLSQKPLSKRKICSPCL